MNDIIIISGPTGVGKTDLAERLAERLQGEIVNADQGQFYLPLAIGTAKPDWKNSAIKQHLFDCVTEPKNFTNAAYQQAAITCIRDIHARGKRALVVGGSGFYYQTLLWPTATLNKPVSPEADLLMYTWEELQRIDPVRAAAIHPHDTYRIHRALDIYYQHGLLPSSIKQVYAPAFPYTLIHVTRETEDLYARINQRTGIMLDQGWLQEAAHLDEAWKTFARQKKTIGYDTIFDYQEGHITYDEMVQTIQLKTRNYAKKQKIFFRSLYKKIPDCDLPRVLEINLTLSPVDLYLDQLTERFMR